MLDRNRAWKHDDRTIRLACENTVQLANALKLRRPGCGTGALRDFSPLYVRFGSGADITRLLSNVRFTLQSGQSADALVCPLSAKTGLKLRVHATCITRALATSSRGFAIRTPIDFATPAVRGTVGRRRVLERRG